MSGCARGASDELDAAVRELHYRATDGRLSRASHAPSPANRRETEEVVLAELKVREAAKRALVAETDEARARAALFAGNLDGAKALLQKVSSYNNASAHAWNDYAVVLHASAADDDVLQLTKAVAASERALDLQPALPEALFNRALLLEALSMRGAAIAAYKTYLTTDSASGWADEARERMRKLETEQSRIASWRDNLDDLERAAEAGDELFINDIAVAYPEESRRWCDQYLARWGTRLLAGNTDGAAAMLLLSRAIGRALEKERGDSFVADAVRAVDAAPDRRALAQAHITYERGRLALARSDTNFAVDTLEQAARQFRKHKSPMAFAARFFITAAPGRAGDLHKLLDEVPVRYRALHAQMQWQLGVIEARLGSRTSALVFLRHASAAFDALGEQANARRVRSAATSVLTAAGDTDAGWRMVGTSLRSAENDEERAFRLYEAAHVAAREERWDALHAIMNAIADTPGVNERIRDDVLTWRSVAAKRAGMRRIAAEEWEIALRPRANRDARFRNMTMYRDMPLAEAVMATPEEAIRLVSKAFDFAWDDPTTANLLAIRAGALRSLGKHDAARIDLERAVALLDRVPFATPQNRLRDALIGSPLDAYSALAEVIDRAGNPSRAAEILERFRVWPRRPQTQGLTIPAKTIVITYALYSDRVAIYAKGQRITVNVPSRTMENSARSFSDAIARNDIHGVRIHGRELSRVLIDPITTLFEPGDLLVIVPDPVFKRLPFGALVRSSGRYLVEDHPIVIAPSLSIWNQASRVIRTGSPAVLSVGNTLTNAEMVALPGAEDEATAVAKMYDSNALLIGPAATKARVLSAMSYSTIVHFAVHANGGETTQAHLLLAAPDGKLTAAEIAALKLQNTKAVVLAGCNTTAGTRSLADAFLEAGAGSVVGTLWDVEDAGTREMSIAFHRSFRDGATAASALQQTQIGMIQRNAPLRVWAALQLYGSGT